MKLSVCLMGVASADLQNEDSKTGSMSAIARYGRQGHDFLYSKGTRVVCITFVLILTSFCLLIVGVQDYCCTWRALGRAPLD